MCKQNTTRPIIAHAACPSRGSRTWEDNVMLYGYNTWMHAYSYVQIGPTSSNYKRITHAGKACLQSPYVLLSCTIKVMKQFCSWFDEFLWKWAKFYVLWSKARIIQLKKLILLLEVTFFLLPEKPICYPGSEWSVRGPWVCHGLCMCSHWPTFLRSLNRFVYLLWNHQNFKIEISFTHFDRKTVMYSSCSYFDANMSNLIPERHEHGQWRMGRCPNDVIS